MATTGDGVPQAKLKRAFTLPYLVFYGLGTTLGAGIYVLIGEVVVEAGALAPFAFLLSAAVAGFTALSFAEFSSRFPESAGEAVYVSEGFEVTWLPTLVGLIVVAAGIVSSAALGRGVAGYVDAFVLMPDMVTVVVAVVLLGGLAALGIQESILVLTVMTIVEAGALLVLIGFGIVADLPPVEASALASEAGALGGLMGVLGGAALAFYAFIGFEDMVNVAEEVHDPRRTLPWGILIVLVVTALIYGGVAIIAAEARGVVDYAAEGAPLAALFSALSGAPPQILAAIGLVAVANGILIQIIMASRVLYGLGKRRLLPGFLATINPRTQTPLTATGLVIIVVLVLALLFNVATLAQVTSLLILVVFATVNAALLRVKAKRGPGEAVFRVPTAIPLIGCVTSALFAAFSAYDLLFL